MFCKSLVPLQACYSTEGSRRLDLKGIYLPSLLLRYEEISIMQTHHQNYKDRALISYVNEGIQ